VRAAEPPEPSSHLDFSFCPMCQAVMLGIYWHSMVYLFSHVTFMLRLSVRESGRASRHPWFWPTSDAAGRRFLISCFLQICSGKLPAARYCTHIKSCELTLSYCKNSDGTVRAHVRLHRGLVCAQDKMENSSPCQNLQVSVFCDVSNQIQVVALKALNTAERLCFDLF